MSEPDAVPLPRDGEVFFDVRGDARSMRVSWYANSKVAVFSIWQGNRCTGTFRLPFVDLARMIQTLQSGPPAQQSGPPAQPPHRDAYPVDPMAPLGVPGASLGYSEGGYAPAYDSAPEPGYHYEQDRRFAASPTYADGAGPRHDQPGPGYGLDHSYGGDHALSGDIRHPAGDYYPAADHYPAANHGAAAGPDYGTGHDYGTGSGFAAAPPYATERPYDGDAYLSSEPYRRDEPYRHSPQYDASEQYGASEPYGASETYRQPGQGTDRPRHGVPGYEPASNSDPRSYRGDWAVATGQPGGAARTDDWPPSPAAPVEPKRRPDSESVPDTAMMSVPSVPARNGPSGYR